MKLQDSLYHITSKNVGESYLSYDIELEASHTNYKVNSQGVLVMPGVCIMLIAKKLLVSDPTTHIVKIIANVSADGIQLANMSFTCKQN